MLYAILNTLAWALLIVAGYMLYLLTGFLAVRYWLKRTDYWGDPLATRTAFICGALAGPLCWILGALIYAIDEPQDTNGGAL